MTRICRIRAFAAMTLCVVAGLCTCSGCDNPVDLLGQANGYTAAVAAGMAARGWNGFPGSAVALVKYAADLRAAIADARAGVVAEGLGDDSGDEPEPPWEPIPLGRAFHIPSQ